MPFGTDWNSKPCNSSSFFRTLDWSLITQYNDVRTLVKRYDELQFVLIHNGVIAQREPNDVGWEHGMFNTFRIRVNSCSFGIISLRDAYRPELNVSRNRVTELPWRTHSALIFAVWRAAEAVKVNPQRVITGMFRRYKEFKLCAGTLIDDPLIFEKGMWANQRLFEVGGVSVSANELVGYGKPVQVRYDTVFGSSFLCNVRMAIIQVHLNALVNTDDRKVSISPQSTPPQDSDAQMRLFKPLLFLKFEGKQKALLRIKGPPCYNIDHAFVRWLLKHSTKLNGEFEGIFTQLRNAIEYEYYDVKQIIARIKVITDRIFELCPELKEGYKALSEIDFEPEEDRK